MGPREWAQGGLPRFRGVPLRSLSTVMSEGPSSSQIWGLCPGALKDQNGYALEVSVRPKGDGAFGIEKIWWMSGDT